MIRLVDQSTSDAWFDFVTTTTADHQSSSRRSSEPPLRTAFPIALQMDLGSGSWESSLIPPNTTGRNTTTCTAIVSSRNTGGGTEGSENNDSSVTDKVTFDSVLVCGRLEEKTSEHDE
jgi:hypothetical protein